MELALVMCLEDGEVEDSNLEGDLLSFISVILTILRRVKEYIDGIRTATDEFMAREIFSPLPRMLPMEPRVVAATPDAANNDADEK